MKYVNKFVRNIPKNSIFIPNSELDSGVTFFHNWHRFSEYDLRKKECVLRVHFFTWGSSVENGYEDKKVTLSEFILTYKLWATSITRGLINGMDREYLAERHLHILQDNAIRELTLKNHSLVCYNDIKITKGT